MTLNSLPPNTPATVRQVRSSGDFRRHLLDMGITPGTTIMVRKVAPFGDPLEISLRGYEITIRREDAKHILIDPVVTNERRGRD